MLDALVNLLRYSAPVALAAIGEAVGQKAGVLNIGLEGTMLSSAFAGLLVDLGSGNPWLALLAGVLTGIAVGLAQAWFTLKLNADPVVVGTAVNLLSLGVTSTAYRFRFGGSGQLLRAPLIGSLTGFDAVAALLVALPVAGVVWWLARKLSSRSQRFWYPALAYFGTAILLSPVASSWVVGAILNSQGCSRRFHYCYSTDSTPKVGDPVLFLSIFLAVAGAVLLSKTKWGLLSRASGEYPSAVTAAGFSVRKVRLQAITLASGLAGLGGAYLTVGVVGSFAENMTAGRGFLALAIVTFGRWRPVWVLGAALLVGAADWAQYALQASGLGIPSQLLRAFPYLLALGVLLVAGSGTSTPAALGKAYEGER